MKTVSCVEKGTSYRLSLVLVPRLNQKYPWLQKGCLLIPRLFLMLGDVSMLCVCKVDAPFPIVIPFLQRRLLYFQNIECCISEQVDNSMRLSDWP